MTAEYETTLRKITPTTELRVLSEGELLAHFRWSDGRVQVVTAAPVLRAAADKWSVEGVEEWVGPGETATVRATPPSDPRFLEVLEDYVARQAGLQTRMSSEREPPPRLFAPGADALRVDGRGSGHGAR